MEYEVGFPAIRMEDFNEELDEGALQDGSPLATFSSTGLSYEYDKIEYGDYGFSTFLHGTFSSEQDSNLQYTKITGRVTSVHYGDYEYDITGTELTEGGWDLTDIDISIAQLQSLSDAKLNALIFAGDDRITGSADADTLLGYAGSDVIYGGAGDDTIRGGAGDDLMAGGKGNDVYRIDEAEDAVVEFSNGGTADSISSSVAVDLFNFVENLKLVGSAAIAGND